MTKKGKDEIPPCPVCRHKYAVRIRRGVWSCVHCGQTIIRAKGWRR